MVFSYVVLLPLLSLLLIYFVINVKCLTICWRGREGLQKNSSISNSWYIKKNKSPFARNYFWHFVHHIVMSFFRGNRNSLSLWKQRCNYFLVCLLSKHKLFFLPQRTPRCTMGETSRIKLDSIKFTWKKIHFFKQIFFKGEGRCRGLAIWLFSSLCYFLCVAVIVRNQMADFTITV